MSRIVAICLVLAMASVSLAAVSPPALVGNWEGTNMDGWVAQGTTTATPGSTIGVTLGAGSLKVAAADAWQAAIKAEWGGWWEATPFTSSTKFSIDITVIASEWELGSALGTDGAETHWGIKPLEALVIAGAGTSGWWLQLNPDVLPDFSGLGDRDGVWKPEDGDKTVTYVFSIPAQGAGSTYENLTLYTNRGVTDIPGAVYMDNAWILVPEPATMALLGLGGLALIRRKK